MADVTVTDGVNTSQSLRFSVLAAAPVITPPLVPASAMAGGPAFSLTVNGSNFNCSGGASNSVVFFRGTSHTPTACTSISMTVQIAASEIASCGTAAVSVFTPPPGGGDSSTLSFSITAPPPVNDSFAQATNITSTPFTDMKDTCGATTEPGEPIPPASCATGQTTTNTHSIWYKFTPPSNGIITADTSGSNFDTILQAVTGSLGNFTEVACNDDVDNAGGDLTSRVQFGATAGTTYFFMVSGFGFPSTDSGRAVFHLSFVATDFTVTGPPATVTVNAGQAATFTITVSPAAAGFSLPVTFSASNLPPFTTASFVPPSVIPGSSPATSTLTITTTGMGSMAPRRLPQPPPPFVWLWLVTATLALASLALARRRLRTRRLALYLPLALLLVSIAGFVLGCGGGGGQIPVLNGTPPGTFTITVTATSGGLSHTTTVTLKVN